MEGYAQLNSLRPFPPGVSGYTEGLFIVPSIILVLSFVVTVVLFRTDKKYHRAGVWIVGIFVALAALICSFFLTSIVSDIQKLSFPEAFGLLTTIRNSLFGLTCIPTQATEVFDVYIQQLLTVRNVTSTTALQFQARNISVMVLLSSMILMLMCCSFIAPLALFIGGVVMSILHVFQLLIIDVCLPDPDQVLLVPSGLDVFLNCSSTSPLSALVVLRNQAIPYVAYDTCIATAVSTLDGKLDRLVDLLNCSTIQHTYQDVIHHSLCEREFTYTITLLVLVMCFMVLIVLL